MLRTLPPSAFWPPPQVDSAIVRYVRDSDKSRGIHDMGLFGAVIGLFLGHRRKMLRACVKAAPPDLGNRDLWAEIFEQSAIDPTRRPEELSPDQYVTLANCCRRLQSGR
jgi:16S rRNA (adenine1518-N6/adenine1519-N6)-dimethyltransferase